MSLKHFGRKFVKKTKKLPRSTKRALSKTAAASSRLCGEGGLGHLGGKPAKKGARRCAAVIKSLSRKAFAPVVVVRIRWL